MTKLPAPALMLGSVLSIQFGQAVGKELSGTVGASGAVALRLGLAAVLLLLLYRPSLPSSRTDAGVILGFGTAIAGMNLIYPALTLLPLGLASALQLLGPVTLALLTSRRLLDAGCAVLAGVGVWLFYAPLGFRFPLDGVLLALASGACMAAYLLLSKQAGARNRGGGALALALTWAAALTVPLGVVKQGTHLLTPQVLLTGTVVAVLSAVLPYSLELAALRRLPTRTVGLLASLEPASAGLAGVLVLDEDLKLVQWTALMCVGAASAGTVTRRQAESPPVRPGPSHSVGTPAGRDTPPVKTCRARSKHTE
ncbi:DMT family transporter [Streptomyces sp. NPDC057376]|uniref:EamA family transporter n=1 Tax=unclassified Streptomyces TaxID=2593676 RepID=UPI000A848017|nr:EamA family transporter [Streptomyces sp. CB02414]